MRAAALADIHGNVHALDAVLADPRCRAADLVVVLGDVVAGTFPVETLDTLLALGDRVRFLRGNADRLVLDDDGESSRWVRARLGDDRLSVVRSWPETFVVDLERLGSVRCVHATPRGDEDIVTRITPDDDFTAVLDGTAENVIVGGHTHVQFDRRVRRWRFVNVGSVGRPWEGRPGAYWALVGPDVELVRTDYHVDAAAADVLRSGQPRAKEIATVLRHPPSAEEATADFEAQRRSARG